MTGGKREKICTKIRFALSDAQFAVPELEKALECSSFKDMIRYVHESSLWLALAILNISDVLTKLDETVDD